MKKLPINLLVVGLCMVIPAASSFGAYLETAAAVSWGDVPGTFGGGSGGIGDAAYSDGYSGGSSFSGTADAHAAFGVLKAFATGTTSNATYLDQRAQAFALFDDDILFNVDSAPGGRAEFIFMLTGSSTGLPAMANLIVINHSKAGMLFRVSQITTAGEYRLVIPVDYNVPQHFEFTLQVTVGIGLGESVTRTADFGNTAVLTAIDLFDDRSDPIASFTLSSDSGTPYPIPEPATMSLLALGALAMIRRRKRT